MRTAIILFAAAAALAAQPLQLIVGQKVSGMVGFYGLEGKQLASVAVGKHPHEIALSSDGQWAYVSDNGILWMTDPGEGGNTISVIDVRRRGGSSIWASTGAPTASRSTAGRAG